MRDSFTVAWHYIAKWIYIVNVKLYNIWSAIYCEPVESDVVIFNEQATVCPGTHSNPVCRKRFCEDCRTNRILYYIHQAKHTVDIAHLTFSHRSIYTAVLLAHQRGVTIRVITDSQMLFVRGSVVKRLTNHGIPVRMAPTRTMMHHKFLIIDGHSRILALEAQKHKLVTDLWRGRHYLMTGSLNWTKQGTAGNFENVVVVTDARPIQSYQEAFDILWHSFKPMSKEALNFEQLGITKDGKNRH